MLAAILHLSQVEFRETNKTSGELTIVDLEPIAQGKSKIINDINVLVGFVNNCLKYYTSMSMIHLYQHDKCFLMFIAADLLDVDSVALGHALISSTTVMAGIKQIVNC